MGIEELQRQIKDLEEQLDFSELQGKCLAGHWLHVDGKIKDRLNVIEEVASSGLCHSTSTQIISLLSEDLRDFMVASEREIQRVIQDRELMLEWLRGPVKEGVEPAMPPFLG